MTASQRTPISVSIFPPQVVVDVVDGAWFAVVSDGAVSVEVTEWPLLDSQFLVDSHTVLRVEVFTAEDVQQFLRGDRQKFAEVCIPALRVKKSNGGVFRGWLGLQRGMSWEEASPISVEAADQRYETSRMLAKNLLTPKLCCSVVSTSFAGIQCPSAIALGGAHTDDNRGLEQCDAMLLQSVEAHSTIITSLHQQVCTLWAKGRLVCGGDKENGDYSAQLTGFDEPSESEVLANHAEMEGRLQDEVVRLTDYCYRFSQRLEEANHAKLRYQERLAELTGEQIEEEEYEEDDLPSMQALQRDLSDLSEHLQVEKVRHQREVEALKCSGNFGEAVGNTRWDDWGAENLRRRHSDELHQLTRAHAAEAERLRASEREQRVLVQELQRKNDSLAQEALRKQALVTVMQDELRERTSRQAEAWNNQASSAVLDGDLPPNAQSLAEIQLEASRREVEQLRQRLIASEATSGGGTNGTASLASPGQAGVGFHGSDTERARSFIKDVVSKRLHGIEERQFCAEVDGLLQRATQLQAEKDRLQLDYEEEVRRCDVAKRHAANLQREVDQAAGEKMMTASTMLDKESQENTLRQEVQSLNSRLMSAEASLGNARAVPQRTGQASELRDADRIRAEQASLKIRNLELEKKLQEEQGARLRLETQYSDSHQSAKLEVEAMRELLMTRNHEYNSVLTEVQRLKTDLQVEKRSKDEQVHAQSESKRRLDQQSRQMDALRAEFQAENQACLEERSLRLERERTIQDREQTIQDSKPVVEALKAELALRENSDHTSREEAVEREARFRCELQDLEDANMTMSQQQLRDFDDMAQLQERSTRFQQAYKGLQGEYQAAKSELLEERRLRKSVEEAITAPPSVSPSEC